MTQKKETLHAFLKRVKTRTLGSAPWSASPSCLLRSWSRSPWKTSENIWETEKQLKMAKHDFTKGKLCMTNLVAFYGGVAALVNWGKAVDDCWCHIGEIRVWWLLAAWSSERCPCHSRSLPTLTVLPFYDLLLLQTYTLTSRLVHSYFLGGKIVITWELVFWKWALQSLSTWSIPDAGQFKACAEYYFWLYALCDLTKVLPKCIRNASGKCCSFLIFSTVSLLVLHVKARKGSFLTYRWYYEARKIYPFWPSSLRVLLFFCLKIVPQSHAQNIISFPIPLTRLSMSFSSVFSSTGVQDRTGLIIFFVLVLNRHIAPKVTRCLIFFGVNTN